jgi:CRISPR/Cas system endoribonuclease Cas6 (RAMP superfamily)
MTYSLPAAYRSTIDDCRLLQKKEEEHAYLFQYGITSGLWEFREELAKFLTAKYGDKVYRYINIYILSQIFKTSLCKI